MSVFVMGPSISGIVETAAPAPPPPGRQRIDWGSTFPAQPGGKLLLRVAPKVADNDIEPANVYAFYVPQDQVPADGGNPDFYFTLTGVANASVHAATADADGLLPLTVPGVQPSLTPYFVQTIVEYPA